MVESGPEGEAAHRNPKQSCVLRVKSKFVLYHSPEGYRGDVTKQYLRFVPDTCIPCILLGSKLSTWQPYDEQLTDITTRPLDICNDILVIDHELMLKFNSRK